jgi:hypothetical protein
LVICSDQLLAFKIHNNFNSRNTIYPQKTPKSYLPTWGEIALPYTSPNLTQNLLSDQLWTPLLYIYSICTWDWTTLPCTKAWWTYLPCVFENLVIIWVIWIISNLRFNLTPNNFRSGVPSNKLCPGGHHFNMAKATPAWSLTRVRLVRKVACQCYSNVPLTHIS